MKRHECLAMLLAGGQGSRLGPLTRHIAKPAVSFGGKYRMIDFTLSNCANSHIGTVGVLTQYRPMMLNAYIGTGAAWDLDEHGAGVSILPPYETEQGGEWYKGTADAVFRNIDYIKMHNPKYVVILSGDHLYNMDYREMIKTHTDNNADLTISAMTVTLEEASRFGILTTDSSDDRILKFTEKPKNPDSTLASMGIYVFNCDVLLKALIEDSTDPDSSHDFGKNIIPKLLAEGKRLYCHKYQGYWKDVGTIPSYYETTMDLLEAEPEFDLFAADNAIMSSANYLPPEYIGDKAVVKQSMIGSGSVILGSAVHSMISVNCNIGEDAVVKDAILLPGAKVEAGAVVTRAILGEGAVVKAGAVFGSSDPESEIAVVGNNAVVEKEEALING